MSYRFFRITNLYNEYLTQYYTQFPWIKERSYKEQHDHLVQNSLDTASSFARNLRKTGVEAFDFFSNAHPLQSRWKYEHGCEKTGKELVLEQIKSIRPEVVWLDDITLIDAEWIAHLREEVPSIKVLTGHLCAPYYKEDIKNLAALDFLITCTPCLKNEFEGFGIKTHLFYHAFDPEILSRIHDNNPYPPSDLLFTGSLYTGGAFHMTRIEFIEDLLRHELPLSIYGNIDTDMKILKKVSAYHTINLMRRIGLSGLISRVPFLSRYETYGDNPVKIYSRQLRQRLNGPVYGIEQFKLLSRSRMSFNLHIDMAKSCAGNARLFEATGVGSCLITDWKDNLSDLFRPDQEVVTYRSRGECIDKVKWLLDNPEEIKKFAIAGQKRTLRDHTFTDRVTLFNDLVRKKL